MPLSRRQLSTPAQNAAEPAWPRARRGRLKEPSDSASDAEDDAEARSGRLESEAELAERRSGGMRGVNLRRAASSDAAATSSPSDPDSEDDAAAKSGRLESDSEFSDRRRGGMGGIPVGGAGPPPPGGTSGTSSSAVKSIVAACSVVAPCCSITRVAVAAVAQGVRLLIWWVWQRTAQRRRAPCASYRSRQRSATCKTELYAAVLSFALEASGQHLDWESKRQQQLYQR